MIEPIETINQTDTQPRDLSRIIEDISLLRETYFQSLSIADNSAFSELLHELKLHDPRHNRAICPDCDWAGIAHHR